MTLDSMPFIDDQPNRTKASALLWCTGWVIVVDRDYRFAGSLADPFLVCHSYIESIKTTSQSPEICIAYAHSTVSNILIVHTIKLVPSHLYDSSYSPPPPLRTVQQSLPPLFHPPQKRLLLQEPTAILPPIRCELVC